MLIHKNLTFVANSFQSIDRNFIVWLKIKAFTKFVVFENVIQCYDADVGLLDIINDTIFERYFKGYVTQYHKQIQIFYPINVVVSIILMHLSLKNHTSPYFTFDNVH